MWVKLGHTFLNLEQVVSVHFLPDDDGTPTATVETSTGTTRHYRNGDACHLQRLLHGLGAPGGSPERAARRLPAGTTLSPQDEHLAFCAADCPALRAAP